MRERLRTARMIGTVVFSAACVAYIVMKVDLARTGHLLAHARLWAFGLALVLLLGLIPVSAWRWQQLLRARGIDMPLRSLTRLYSIAYAATQVLPTSVGGDAVRLFDVNRRRPGQGGDVAASILLERLLGAVATLALAPIGVALALGQLDLGAYLWIEVGLSLAVAMFAALFFVRRLRPLLALAAPVARLLRVERLVLALYDGVNGYRGHRRLLLQMLALTFAMQVVRTLVMWLAGVAAHVDVSPKPFFVMGPLLLLIMVVPFTVNGFALRESFFVSFLGLLNVDANHAFSTGFLFFLLTLSLGLPGAFLLLGKALRDLATHALHHARPVPTQTL